VCVNTHIYIKKYYSVIKKNEILSFSGKCIELKYIMLHEMNQAQKDKCHMFSLIQIFLKG
jgi:hypothetical protein